MKIRHLGSLLLGTGLALLCGQVHASTIDIYSAVDAGAGPGDPHPMADAAEASFDAAVATMGSVQVVDFEAAPLGGFSVLSIAPGINLMQTGSTATIRNSPLDSPAPLYGFNTSAGGNQYLNLMGSSATFTFATPISAFAAYFTGVQGIFGLDSVVFSDNSVESFPLPVGAGNAGGVGFFGFVDSGAQITSVTIDATHDDIGVDDVQVAGTALAPEPSSFALLGTGLLGVAGVVRRRAV